MYWLYCLQMAIKENKLFSTMKFQFLVAFVRLSQEFNKHYSPFTIATLKTGRISFFSYTK